MGLLKECFGRLRKVPPEHFLLLLLAMTAVSLWMFVIHVLPKPLEVTFFDVGKGDAILIRGPKGRTVLIDGGSSNVPDVGKSLLVPNLMVLGVRRLDAIIMTHSDSDHINGIPAILTAIPVGMILDPEMPDEETCYQQLVTVASDKGIPRFRIRAGDEVNLGAGARLRILAPGTTLLTGTTSDTNNNSVVCLLEYRHARMLFTGDLESEGEHQLLAQHVDLHADVLKVAHHGSRNGTTTEFLHTVAPAMAVISCPTGGSGTHPAPETLARLRAGGIKILRTDVSGQIRLHTDGNGWQVKTFRQ